MDTKLLINGKFVAGKGAKEDVLDPATGKTLVGIAEASDEQIEAAVDAASMAFCCAAEKSDISALYRRLSE